MTAEKEKPVYEEFVPSKVKAFAGIMAVIVISMNSMGLNLTAINQAWTNKITAEINASAKTCPVINTTVIDKLNDRLLVVEKLSHKQR